MQVFASRSVPLSISHDETATRLQLWPALLAAFPLVAWDLSGLDLRIARLMATSRGFPWQHHWLPARLLYVAPRALDAVLLGALVSMLCFPALARGILNRHEIAWWLGTTVFCLLLIVAMKQISSTSCPWSLAEFGGDKAAAYVSHWALGQVDGGPGGCFPSGHASTAFAFLPGWYVLHRHSPTVARRWLCGVLVAGSIVAVSQTVRGAHYVGHSLWTAWLCWLVSGASFYACRRWRTAG